MAHVQTQEQELSKTGDEQLFDVGVLLVAGNIEKLYVQWVDDKFQNGTRKCPSPTTVACPSKQEDEFCPAEQPAWSAFRCEPNLPSTL